MEKNPAGYFKLENWKNQVQIDRGIDIVTKLKFMVCFNMEATPKSDIKSVNKSDTRFDISIKPTT